MNIEKLQYAFIEQFGKNESAQVFFAPGRVNLIGEHTDYNGGHVFPCALNVGTTVIARKRNDRQLRFYSLNFSELGIIEGSIDGLTYKEEDDWANYPKGVMAIFQEKGLKLDAGLDLLYDGNIPNGAGLSSSASIEMATAVMLNKLFACNQEMIELVKIAQKAENEFIGVNCGIMDQFASGLGKEDHAILLDCQTLKYEYSPLQLDDYVLIIANTNKRRGLADSKYNERRQQCERALVQLQSKLQIDSLGELTEKEFEENKYLIQDDIDRKRAKHAVYENRRTLAAVEKLNIGDIEGFGQLMNESHISLRDDYEVTGPELDALAKAAWDAGAIGARMTGAGFGGCTINLVKKVDAHIFIEKVDEAYTKETSLKADFYTVKIGDGARAVSYMD
ncbi:galactokinase [Bacillus sp. FJAT-50079]|uniref:galactokinase n=1 Tax=Bacillus sp. FJAT-50079 TaxID=2833577 RepID=UPI001BC9269F|nr:galactokinase [Bacillus sp. FJAT-50079]MBS4208266.1 galactokinase [Bacillus sp. FJAT-50079]